MLLLFLAFENPILDGPLGQFIGMVVSALLAYFALWYARSIKTGGKLNKKFGEWGVRNNLPKINCPYGLEKGEPFYYHVYINVLIACVMALAFFGVSLKLLFTLLSWLIFE